MYQGEDFPIPITISFTPPILLSDIAGAKIVVANNSKQMLLFDKDTGNSQRDGDVTLDDTTGSIIASCICTRAMTKLWKAGEVEIELLLKVTVSGFPAGYYRVAQFTEPVLKAFSATA